MRKRTAEENSELLRQWFEEVWNQRSESALMRLMAPDAKAYGLDEQPVDREGFKAGWRSFLETFPDVSVTVDDVVAQEHKTAARITVSGTHLGQGLGVEPSGRYVSFQAHTLCHWRDGQICAGWNVIDMVSAYRQIGASKL